MSFAKRAEFCYTIPGGNVIRLDVVDKKALNDCIVEDRRFNRIMTNIEVSRTDHGDSYEFQVTVK